jgi:hypothetical protein
MKCPACGYTSFPYLDRCRKCGQALGEARAVYGAYARTPTPLDLMLAYEVAPVDAAEAANPEDLPTPTIDLSELHEIELELTESGEASSSSAQGGGLSGAAEDATPTFDLNLQSGSDSPPGASDGARYGAEDDLPVPTLDLSGLDDLALELTEVAEDAHMSPREPSMSPPVPGEVEQVFDLDLDEDEPELRPLDSEAEPSRRVDDDDEEDEGSEEYVLEIEDELELELDELEFEDDENAEDEDGDDAKR